ncbi:TIR domain-containing protein [Oscillatoria sp. FACHB-1407]|uniref:toll/interleukin-1 receptor domain-containing protein n=1 Tax=Oscillatoria sp. FACHB-1407 TaxID=2692847 RepID=UPI0016826A93|nr:toll/interleukin-1 receptor domain-containing protein [Oscillatoria sp. FACHB-1407]MBD2462589.1 TIR domain-containing protein [Oscillatoria sp. FACHB-1407]
MSESVKVFFSYSHKDEALRDALAAHLSSLEWQKVISSWHDRKIMAGTEWDADIKFQMDAADIILLLISPDFIASKYCREIEIPYAMQRHEAKEAYVIPIILRPFDWQDSPFSKLQAYPKDAKAVTSWENIDEAFVSVTQGIRTVAKFVFEQRQQRLQQKEADKARYLKKVEEVLSDGKISVIEQDTLDELQEELGLTSEEAREIRDAAYLPYKKYAESFDKYRQTLNKIIAQGYYPFNDETRRELELRQRDLGLKPEDVEQIETPILKQAEIEYQQRQEVKAVQQHEVQSHSSQPSSGEVTAATSVPPLTKIEKLSTKDEVILELLDSLFDALSSSNIEIGIEKFKGIAHRSLLLNGHIEPGFLKHNLTPAFTKTDRYKQPIQITSKKLSGRTKLGLRTDKEEGEEEIFMIARNDKSGGLDGQVRIFFPANGEAAKISGVSL